VGMIISTRASRPLHKCPENDIIGVLKVLL